MKFKKYLVTLTLVALNISFLNFFIPSISNSNIQVESTNLQATKLKTINDDLNTIELNNEVSQNATSTDGINVAGIVASIMLAIFILLLIWVLWLYFKKRDKKPKNQKKKDSSLELYNNANKKADKFASLEFFEKTIPIIEKYNQTINSISTTDVKIKKILQGFQMISKNFEDALNKENVKVITPLIGDIVDYEKMKIVSKTLGVGPSGAVAKTIRKGYILHDKVIAKAEVIIFE